MKQNYLFSALFLLFSHLIGFSQSPSEVGRWSDPIGFGIVPVAVSNLPDGRLITWSSQYKLTYYTAGRESDGLTWTELFDPFQGPDGAALGEFQSNTDHDMFCPGINNLPDGRILSAGGTSHQRTSIYDPATGQWSVADEMNVPRGYQGNVTLSDGSVFTLGGSWGGGDFSDTNGGKDGELWTEQTGWILLPGISGDDTFTANDLNTESQGVYRADNHLWLWPASNGRIFHAGPSEMMHWISVENGGSMVDVGLRANDSYSMKGTTVMFDVDRILKVGGAESYDRDHPAKDNSYVIDFSNENNVTVTPTVNRLTYSRTMHNSTVLPNGEVLVTGGLDHAEVFSDVGARLTAEIYNPESNTWRTVAGMQVPRTYHSVAILMVDGRVFVGGGGLCDNSNPAECVNHTDAEIYSPSYLFNNDGSLATRPTISAPETADYNTSIPVTGSSGITDFNLIRFSSATHSTNNEQRRIPVSFTGNGSYTVNIPDRNLLPPGYYMLFGLNANGVPSVAETIQIGNSIPLSEDPSLVLDLKFDDASGSVARDDSQYGNNATIYDVDNRMANKTPSTGNWGSGLFGGALETDGVEFQSNTIVDVPTSASMQTIANTMTVMAWVNRDDIVYNASVFTHDYPAFFFGFHNSLYKWEIYTSEGVGSCLAGYTPTSQWVHIAATYDGQMARLYANGQEVCSKPVTGNLVLNTAEANFSSFTTSGFYERRTNPASGYNGSGVTDELDGRIDEVKVFNRVLNAGQVKFYYDQGVGLTGVPDCPQGTLVVEYRHNGGEWTTGNTLNAELGDEVYIRARDYSGQYYLTTPIAYSPTFNSTDPNDFSAAFGAYLIDTNLRTGLGRTSQNNDGQVDSNSAGQYVLTTPGGCIEVFTLTFDAPPVDCTAGSIIPEYRLDGVWDSGENYVTVTEGTEVMFSMLPNNIGVTVTLPNGTVVGDDYNLGNVTVANSGVYTIVSAEGCETFVELTVTPNCAGTPIQAEYQVDGGSVIVGPSANIDQGGSLRLGIQVDGLAFSISGPNGNTKGLDTSDLVLADLTLADSGTYTISSAEGCQTTFTLTVVELPAGCDPLPGTWVNSDIGAVGATGSVCYDNGTFEVAASGADIWGAVDEFHYVYQPLAGDGEIIARVVSLENTDPWAKAGVMMRNTLDANSAMVLVSMSPNPDRAGSIGYSLQDRAFAGQLMTASANSVGPFAVAGYPYYVRLVRQGNTFTGYASATNGNWTLVSSRNLDMNSTIYVGIATTSHRDGTLTNAVYDNVQVLGGSAGGNRPPTAVASATTLSGVTPLEVQFTGENSSDDAGIVSYSWDFGDGGSSNQENPQYTYQQAGSFTARLTVTDAEDLSSSATVTIVVSDPVAGCDAVPAPWGNSDVGAVGAAGSVCYSNGAFEVEASGADIWGAVDEFHYVYQTLTGDGEIIARVVSQENTTGWAKAGVMMRNTLDGNSATVHIGMNPNPNGLGISYSMQHRAFAGQAMTVSGNNLGPVSVGSYPYYVRLVRQGNTFTGYASATNGNWTLLGTRTISMNSTVYVGLATTSVRDGILGTSVYDNVQVLGGSAGGNRPPTAVASATTLSGVTPLEVQFTGENSSDDAGIVSYSWDFGDGGSSNQENPQYTYQQAGSFTARLTVTDAEDLSSSATVTIVVSDPVAGCDAVPAPWGNSDVGAVGAAGSVCYSNGTFEVEASGADIWGAVDEFHYVYQTLTGDGEIIARVVSQENTTGWAKAGVMMRNTLAANSATVHIGMNPNPNGLGISYSMQHRAFAGQAMTVSGNNLGPVSVGSYPYYVRLVRQGNTFTGYASATNGNWTLLGTRTISMNSTVYVGLATTSVRDGILGTSVYDNVQVLGGSAGGNRPPTAVASATTLSGVTPLEVQFTGENSSDDAGIVSYSWDFGDGGSSNQENPLYTYQQAGSFTARLTVTDAEDLSSSATVTIVVSDPVAGCDAVPAPWGNSDVGAVGAAGSVCYSNGTFEVEASGADIWGAVDEFHYVYQTLTGDGEIIARVVSQENTTGWAKAGVMMRNTLNANSATVHIGMNPNPNFRGISYSMQHRAFAGQAMTVSGNNLGPVSVGSYPYYVRLVRQGNTFTGYASATNGNWTLLGSRTISMNSTIYVGLATTSVRDGILGTSVYDNVQVLGGSAGAGSAAKSPDLPLDSESEALNSETLPATNTEDLFEVYPNPTSGILNLNLAGYTGQAADVFIMNTANQLVWQRRFDSNHASEETIDLGTLQDGMYFVVVQSAIRRDVQQVVLVR